MCCIYSSLLFVFALLVILWVLLSAFVLGFVIVCNLYYLFAVNGYLCIYSFDYSGFLSTLQIERANHTCVNCILRPSEKFTAVCWCCYWTCVLIKCIIFDVMVNGIWSNWLVDVNDSSIWCNNLTCTLEWNFIRRCKFVPVSHKQTT